jgi:CubicO group peptidase (beta-lactamase class C family)
MTESIRTAAVIGAGVTFSWGGAYGSQYRVDPEARLTIVFMMQLLPSRTDVAQKFPNVVYQALTDAPRVGTSH